MSTSIQTKLVTLPINSDFMQYAHERAVEHNAKFKPSVFKSVPPLESIDELCVFGVYSRTLLKSELHYLSIAASVDINGATCSITEVSRWYLDYYHPNSLRSFGSLTRSLWELSQRPPLYVHRSTIRKASYVDIKSTYYSILSVVGWNVDYYPHQWVIQGRLPLDFPLRNDKVARSYLVTASLKSVVGMWTGKRAFYRQTRNRHINYSLWGIVTDILHSIAQYAVDECEAVYVHTDGYIIPEEYTDKLINHISSWGLLAGVKHNGECMVCGFSNFMVGERRTEGFNPAKYHQDVDGIDRTVDRIWLRNAVVKAQQIGNGYRLYDKSIR